MGLFIVELVNTIIIRGVYIGTAFQIGTCGKVQNVFMNLESICRNAMHIIILYTPLIIIVFASGKD